MQAVKYHVYNGPSDDPLILLSSSPMNQHGPVSSLTESETRYAMLNSDNNRIEESNLIINVSETQAYAYQ